MGLGLNLNQVKNLKDAYEYGFNFGHLLINKENKK